MNKTQFYAIKELTSGLFLTYDVVTPKFFPLGDRTKFYERQSDAMSRIEKGDLADLIFWDDMEKHSGKDRWHLDISKQFFEHQIEQYKFKVVKVEIKELV